jgi:hypothetical protein
MDPQIAANLADAITRQDEATASELINQVTQGRPRMALRFTDRPIRPSSVIWEVVAPDQSIIWVTRQNLDHALYALRLTAIVTLAQSYAMQEDVATGCVAVRLGDLATIEGLGFCSASSQVTLIPDAVWLRTLGYRESRASFRALAIPWSDKHPIAFWRGATSGRQKSLLERQRVTLCLMVEGHMLFDVGIILVPKQLEGHQPEVDALRELGIVRDYVPQSVFMRYKYQIDIDGNTNSWPGLFHKLLTGSPVLKVASEGGFRQWYYDRLVPWRNYVPVEADMSDLAEKAEWLVRHDGAAEAIGRAGFALADSLRWPDEVIQVAPTISAAIRASGLSSPGDAAPGITDSRFGTIEARRARRIEARRARRRTDAGQ